MSIVIPGETVCPICEAHLGEPYLSTSGIAFPKDHELWRYCDTALHQSCLEKWPKRKEFAEGYYRAAVSAAQNGYGVLLLEGDDWLLACGRPVADNPPVYVEVRLREWPLRLYSLWENWLNFVGDGYRTGLTGETLWAASKCMREVRRIAPDAHMLALMLESRLG